MTVDQAAHRGGWADLGEHVFEATDVMEFRLEDLTGEPFHGVGDPRSRRVAFDAIRLTPHHVTAPDAGAVDPRDAGPTRDAGAMDAGAGEGPLDGGDGAEPDAGAGDAGGGCGCRVGATGRPSATWLLARGLGWLGARSRRRARLG